MQSDDRAQPSQGTSTLRTGTLVFLIVCAIVFPLVLGLGMTRGLSHDEHQHVASGALIAREHLLPYRDFPHFHTPYLAYLYALLFGITDHLLLLGRLVSVLSATAIAGILGSVAYLSFRTRGKRIAVLVCASSVLLLLSTALFGRNTGLAWNHEPALLLTLLAFVIHLAGLKSARSGWFVASGALLGLAIGTRITCAPLLAPFGLALLLYPEPHWRWNRIAAFVGGSLIGLAGLLTFFIVAPEQTFFGNFEFARINVTYRLDSGEPRTMTILQKLRFFFKEIIRPDAGLFLACLPPLFVAWWGRRRSGHRLPVEIRFILLLLPFVLIGSFAPSPLFDQYFYPLLPFAILLGLYALAAIPPQHPWSRRLLLTGSAAVLLSTAMGLRGYRAYPDFFTPNEWRGIRLHRRMATICADLPPGKVLTLSPILPLEAGLSIYPAFSTGPFAWRISPYLDAAKAARLRIVSPTSLDSLIQGTPPVAVLVGFEESGEELFSAYARLRGDELRQPWADDRHLWVKRW